MKIPYTCALFDIDGTLLDTTAMIREAMQYTYRTVYKKDIEIDQIPILVGKTLRQCYELFGPVEDMEVIRDTHSGYQDKQMHLVKPFEGVIETLTFLQQGGVKIGAVTNRSSHVNVLLNVTKIHTFFDCVVTIDDVRETKPHPEAVNLALRKLNQTADRALLVGDAHEDIIAGKAAGVDTVGVTYDVLGETIRDFKPDFVIDSFSELLQFFS